MPVDTLLARRERTRQAARLALRERVRVQLREALRDVLPGTRVWVFGSLVRPGRFGEASDVDIALEAEPSGISRERLTSELEERLGRPVDVVLLGQTRFRDQIVREGELWTP